MQIIATKYDPNNPAVPIGVSVFANESECTAFMMANRLTRREVNRKVSLRTAYPPWRVNRWVCQGCDTPLSHPQTLTGRTLPGWVCQRASRYGVKPVSVFNSICVLFVFLTLYQD